MSILNQIHVNITIKKRKQKEQIVTFFSIMYSFLKQVILILVLILSNHKGNGQKIINLEKVNGIFVIPCKVNGILMNFIFDTGATDVSISLTEAMFLMKQGLLNGTDIKEEIKYKLANGKVENGTKIILKEIEIEGLILRNVEASIIHNMDAPLLLGITAISKLGKVVIDNDKLIIFSQENNFTPNLLESDFESDIEKAFVSLFQTLKSKNYNQFSGKYGHLFDIPLYYEDEKSIFNSKLNGDSLQKEKELKYLNESLSSLYQFGVKHSLNWNNIKSTDIKISTDETKIIIKFLYLNDVYIMTSDSYVSSIKNKKVINLPTDFQTINAHHYNKAIKELFDKYEKKELTEIEYRNKAVEYAEWQYKYLSKNDIHFIEEHFRIDGIYQIRAQTLYQNGEYLTAMKDFNKVITLQSKRFLSEAIYLRGRCKHQLEDYNGAILDYNKYIELDRQLNYETVFFYRANAKYDLKKYNDALIDYNKAATATPADSRVFFNRGLLRYYELADKKGGCNDWSKAGELGHEEAYKLISENCN